jgi:hypothetical protein
MKPIIFSTPMVRAILEDRKTMTRRVVKPQPPHTMHIIQRGSNFGWSFWGDGPLQNCFKAPYIISDVLWVREAGGLVGGTYYYKADTETEAQDNIAWDSPIYMPKAAARLFLRVKAVRVERVQEISEKDAIAEGVPDAMEGNTGDEIYCPTCMGMGLVGAVHPVSLGYMEVECTECDSAVKRFCNLWDGINAKRGYGWDVNPWVWVIEFERCEKPKEATCAR